MFIVRHSSHRATRVRGLAPWRPQRATLPLIAGGWVVHAIPVFRREDGSLSIGVPSSVQLDSAGRIKQRDGKRQYSAVLSFENAEARSRWQRLVLGALAAGGIRGEV